MGPFFISILDVRCSSPPEIEHAKITGVRKAKYLPGEKVQYRCNADYVPLGNSFITCLKKGWTQIPRCTGIMYRSSLRRTEVRIGNEFDFTSPALSYYFEKVLSGFFNILLLEL